VGLVATAAWACAIPCALVAVVIMLTLGRPVGSLLFDVRAPFTFLREVAVGVWMEPTEHARYLLAICASLMTACAVALMPRWLPHVPRRALTPLAVTAQLALGAVVVVSIIVQYEYRFGYIYTGIVGGSLTMHYFTPATLVVALALTTAIVAALRQPRLRASAADLLSGNDRRRALVGAGIALLATGIWLLYTVHTDLEAGNMPETLRYNLSFVIDETFSVLNGRTPLVDFTPQYSSLLPYLIAVSLAAVGKTLLAFTATVAVITATALFAIYGVFRRVVKSPVAAVLLYLPFLATSLYQTSGTFQNRAGVGSYYGVMPLRYGMPFVLAYLTARHISKERTTLVGTWLLFTVAGLTVLNNVEFGVAALGGTLAACLWTSVTAIDRATLGQLAVGVASGLLTALGLVSLITLLRSGSMPQLERAVDYARLYGLGGFSMRPMPGLFGMHLLVYLTYVAAMVLATVRALRRDTNRTLTGMLAWASVFGLGAASYYVGRSHPNVLKYEFSAWALALGLLAVAAIGELSAPRLRHTALGGGVVLFGYCVMFCSLAQTPTPWGQVQRLQGRFVATYEEPDPNPLVAPSDAATRRFVASIADGPHRFVLKRGAPVAILVTTGHRVADAYGITNVSPYTGLESLFTVERVDDVINALRRAGGNTVIVPDPYIPSVLTILQRRGFRVLTPQGLSLLKPGTASPSEMLWPGDQAIMKWVDTRHLRPKALR